MDKASPLARREQFCLPVTEQLLATEQDIRLPRGSSPDRHRTNTKPLARVYRRTARRRSRSHSLHNRERSLKLLRGVQGQHRDRLRGQLPNRHRDHRDASYHRSSCRRRASSHQRHASHHHSNDHLRHASRYHWLASQSHHRDVHCRAGQLMTAQPNLPATQPPSSQRLTV